MDFFFLWNLFFDRRFLALYWGFHTVRQIKFCTDFHPETGVKFNSFTGTNCHSGKICTIKYRDNGNALVMPLFCSIWAGVWQSVKTSTTTYELLRGWPKYREKCWMCGNTIDLKLLQLTLTTKYAPANLLLNKLTCADPVISMLIISFTNANILFQLSDAGLSLCLVKLSI